MSQDTVSEMGLEVIDADNKCVKSPDDISSSSDLLKAIDNVNEENLVLGDEVFQEIYEASHKTNVPEQRVQTGRILAPVVRPSARNIEQELSISIPIVLPDGESVKMYTALYGSNNPDSAIDKMIHQYTSGEPKISKLMGVSIPLIYINGEWKMYLINQKSILGLDIHAWIANNLRSLVSDSDIFEFGKQYDTPFEDDPKLVQEGDPTSLKSIVDENQNI